MYRILGFHLLATFILATGCNNKNEKNSDNNQTNGDPSSLFPSELVDFIPIEQNPVFKGTGTDTWDRNIRERGYILKEDDIYKMWYTGFDGKADPTTMYLGYATSDDGIQWTRHAGNPIFDEYWTEDVHVVKHEGRYYMVAEGVDDIAHMLTSIDGIHWQRQGDLDIRKVNGDPIDPGAYGTPTLWIEDDNNPIMTTVGDDTNISSPILVHDGEQYRLYTMHEYVRVYNPNSAN